ncbi:MAG: GNAT family N-acetyltransferase [Sporichthyaceae bacterium]
MLAPQPAETLHLEPMPYDHPVPAGLIAAVQEYYAEIYGSPDASPVDASEFAPPHGLLLVGSIGGEPVACGGWRLVTPELAEIKRMYVAPTHRRRGLSRLLLAALEDSARAAGAQRLCLQTGYLQVEALELYRSSGWDPIEKFGVYAEHPGCFCFGKTLA